MQTNKKATPLKNSQPLHRYDIFKKQTLKNKTSEKETPNVSKHGRRVTQREKSMFINNIYKPSNNLVRIKMMQVRANQMPTMHLLAQKTVKI